MDLDIDFFGEDLVHVDRLKMVQCSANPCPAYFPDAGYSWALETPVGTLEPPAEGTMLSVGE